MLSLSKMLIPEESAWQSSRAASASSCRIVCGSESITLARLTKARFSASYAGGRVGRWANSDVMSMSVSEHVLLLLVAFIDTSYDYSLDLIERNLSASAVIKLGGCRAFVVGDGPWHSRCCRHYRDRRLCPLP